MSNKKIIPIFLLFSFLFLPFVLAQPSTIGEEDYLWLWVALVAFLLLLAIYLLFKKPSQFIPSLFRKSRKEPWLAKEIERSARKEQKQEEAKEKIKQERERQELFSLFELGEAVPHKLSYVDLLGKVAKAHELRKGRRFWELKAEEKAFFQEMEKMTKKLKAKEQAVEKLTEEEARDIFARLKAVIKEKK